MMQRDPKEGILKILVTHLECWAFRLGLSKTITMANRGFGKTLQRVSKFSAMVEFVLNSFIASQISLAILPDIIPPHD